MRRPPDEDVAIVSFAQWSAEEEPTRNEVEMLMPVVARGDRATRASAARRSASRARAVRLPRRRAVRVRDRRSTRSAPGRRSAESHVEMDGAWALYEAWVRLQHGDIDSALVYAFGKSSLGDLPDVLSAAARPLLPGAALARRDQRRRAAGARAARRRPRRARDGRGRGAQPPQRQGQPVRAGHGDDGAGRRSCAEPYIVSPLRKHDCPPISDGAAAIVLAAGDLAREVCERPGLDPRHRPPHRAARPRRARPRARRRRRSSPARRRASDGAVDVAELHAPFTPPGADPRARRSGSSDGVERQPVGRRARGEPDDGGGPDAHRRGGAPASSTATPTGPSPTRPRARPAAEPRVRAGGRRHERALRGRRHRPDEAHVGKRNDVSIAGLVREAASRALDDAEMTLAGHRRRRHRQGARHVRGRR